MINISDFAVLPAIIFMFSLFIIVFLFTLKIKTSIIKRIYIIFAFTGFVGFSLTFALPLFKPFYYSYFLVPVGFFIMGGLGIIGCILKNVNPFNVNVPLFIKKEKKQKRNTPFRVEKEEAENAFEQKIEEAEQLIHLLLAKMGSPYIHFRNVILQDGDEAIEIPFIVVGSNGVFPVYICNWSGTIHFNDNEARKTLSAPTDIDDLPLTGMEHKFLKKIMDTIGFHSSAIRTVICTTNPSSSIQGSPQIYDVVDLGDLSKHIKSIPAQGKTFTTADIFDIQNAIELNNLRKKDLE